MFMLNTKFKRINIKHAYSANGPLFLKVSVLKISFLLRVISRKAPGDFYFGVERLSLL